MEDCLDRDYGAAEAHFALHATAPYAQRHPANTAAQPRNTAAAISPTTASCPTEYNYAIDRDYRHATAAVAQTRTRRQELESAADRDYRASALDLVQLRIRHTQAGPTHIAAQAPAYPADTEDRDFAQAAADRANFHHLADLICTPDRHYNAAAVDLARFRARPTADPAAAVQVCYGKIRPTTQLDVERACAGLVPCTVTRAKEGTTPGNCASHDVDSDPGYDSLDAISSANLLQRLHSVMASRVPTPQTSSTPYNATPPMLSSIHGPHAGMDCT